jgi:hypothetical protein
LITSSFWTEPNQSTNIGQQKPQTHFSAAFWSLGSVKVTTALLMRRSAIAQAVVQFGKMNGALNGTERNVASRLVVVAPKVAPTLVRRPIRTLVELQKQIHDDLRAQHPEWIGPNGESPMCDFYEARLSQLLESYARSAPETVASAA